MVYIMEKLKKHRFLNRNRRCRRRRSHRKTSGKANSVNGNEFEGEPAEISVQKSVKRSSEVKGDT